MWMLPQELRKMEQKRAEVSVKQFSSVPTIANTWLH